MSDIVNLRRARKRKARANAESEAATRRARFGAPHAARQADHARLELAAKKLEAHRLEPPGSARPGDEK
jgi:hypothetical protein